MDLAICARMLSYHLRYSPHKNSTIVGEVKLSNRSSNQMRARHPYQPRNVFGPHFDVD